MYYVSYLLLFCVVSGEQPDTFAMAAGKTLPASQLQLRCHPAGSILDSYEFGSQVKWSVAILAQVLVSSLLTLAFAVVMSQFTPFDIGQIKAHVHHGLTGAAISRILLQPDGKSHWSETAVQIAVKKLLVEETPDWRGEQALLCTDLQMNIWSVDVRPHNSQNTCDLLGVFTTSRNFGVEGRVWIELKVHAANGFGAKVAKWKTKLAATLEEERSRDDTIEAVLLVAAEVKQGTSTLVASLFVAGSSEWVALAGGSKRGGRGMAVGPKPVLSKVWEKMQWCQSQDGRQVGLLKQYLQAFKLPVKNPGQRAATFNGILRDSGHVGRVYETRIKNKCGRAPWVASKATYRAIYKYL